MMIKKKHIMNVVLQLLKLKYDIPKDILLYIIHMFRPRPPFYYGYVLETWDTWHPKRSHNNRYWYNWVVDVRVSSNVHSGEISNLGIVSYCDTSTAIENDRWGICSLCLKGNNTHLCRECVAAIRKNKHERVS